MTPCYNEEAGIRECYQKIKDLFDQYLPEYEREHLFIDNSSSDKTVSILKSIASEDRHVKIIVNSRNFGLSRSPYHGMLQVSGDAVIPVVADLQTPPETILEFVRQWENGYKIVIGVRRAMTEPFVTRMLRNTFYNVIGKLSKVEQIQHFIGFCLIDKVALDVLRSLHDPDPYFRGQLSEIGFEKAFVTYDQPPRKHGKSRHSFFDLFELAMLGLTTYSKVPIRLLTFGGVVLAGLSLLGGLFYLVLKLLFWDWFPGGVAPLVIGMFFFSAINLLALGLVGEYVLLVFQYTRNFPLVVELERINFDVANHSSTAKSESQDTPEGNSP